MMTAIFIVLGVGFGVFLLYETMSFMMADPILKDKDVLDAIQDNIDKKEPTLSGCILHIGDMPYISTSTCSFIFKYYIGSVGIIPFWYKSSKVIDIIYKGLRKSERSQNRKKLGVRD